MTDASHINQLPVTQASLERLSRLVDLSVSLNSTLDLDELLHIIIRTAAELLGCEAASILLYDEKQPHLFFAATSASNADQLKQLTVPIENSLAGTVFRTNRPIVINNASKDPRHYGAVAKKSGLLVQSLLGVPMRIRNRLTGVIEALNKIGGEFTAEDESLLSVIGSHAAVAIHNARLVYALQQALDKANEADRLKSDFLTLASHELRTPLGIIIGYATFLREDAQGELSEHAEQVLNAALKMRALVEDMTNLTLLETDGLVYKVKPASAQGVLHAAAKEVHILAEAKAQRIVFDTPENEIIVHVDVEKMVSALVNVLNNAIRFSPIGEQIILGARPEGTDALVWVQDNGLGIARENLERIFREFKQGEDPLTRRYGGLGLGLSIARGLIVAQGGRIWAESEGPGKGATFKILMPGAPPV
jgi:K+-sensing histidine kinase KdpD